jgi:hypothetical protein
LGNLEKNLMLWIRKCGGKQKGLGYSPSPDYYQTTVVELLHKINAAAQK